MPAVLNALEEALACGTVKYDLKQTDSIQDQSQDEIQSLKRRLERVDQKELRAREAYMEGIDTKEDYRKNKELLNREREELTERISQLEDLPQKGYDDTVMLDRISNVLDILHSDKFSVSEKNSALKSIIDKIIYDKEQNHIDVYYYMMKAPENLVK